MADDFKYKNPDGEVRDHEVMSHVINVTETDEKVIPLPREDDPSFDLEGTTISGFFASDDGNARRMGQILLDSGAIQEGDFEKIEREKEKEGIRFGEAAQKLGLITQDDVQYALARQFDFPCLRPGEGVVSEKLTVAIEPFGAQTEKFRTLRSELQLKWLSKGHRILAVASADEAEGKSYVVSNLAVTFSQLGRRTLIIDANLRSPCQHEIFGTPNFPGLSALLAGKVTKNELTHLAECPPFMTNLAVLGGGVIPPNPTELLGRGGLAIILDRLRQHFDVIIIDTPSGHYKADMQAIISCSDGALFVARKNKSKMIEMRKLGEMVKSLNTEVVGAVINEF